MNCAETDWKGFGITTLMIRIFIQCKLCVLFSEILSSRGYHLGQPVSEPVQVQTKIYAMV